MSSADEVREHGPHHNALHPLLRMYETIPSDPASEDYEQWLDDGGHATIVPAGRIDDEALKTQWISATAGDFVELGAWR
jgi:hypothetical protein